MKNDQEISRELTNRCCFLSVSVLPRLTLQCFSVALFRLNNNLINKYYIYILFINILANIFI